MKLCSVGSEDGRLSAEGGVIGETGGGGVEERGSVSWGREGGEGGREGRREGG